MPRIAAARTVSPVRVLATGALTTRDRLIAAMADAMRRKGVHGVGLTELLEIADAPKGVLYHHFPGGKAELTVHAIGFSVARIVASLDRLLAATDDVAAALTAWLDGALAQLEGGRFETGCPLATVALETTADDVEIRRAVAEGFAAIRRRLADAIAASGVPRQRAAALATTLVAAYEGALIAARVAESTAPIREMADCMIRLVRAETKGAKTKAPTKRRRA
jgi:TetR/AcrR family transcriptional repressor of lmrAB and yxaGH operons